MSGGRYKIGSVVRETGFSSALLRAWEKRYGILAPERASGGHRLYSEEDLAVLRRVRQLLDEGRSIGEISLAGREALLAARPGFDAPAGADASGDVLSPGVAVPATVPASGRPGDDELSQLADAIVRSTVLLDGDGIESALERAFSRVSPSRVIAAVIEPAARDIGALWSAGRCSVAGEHLASSLFVGRLLRLLQSTNPTHPDAPPSICACFPDEQHELGALIVAYHLSRMGLKVSYLGPSLPFDDLELALSRLEPRAVYLSVTRPALLLAHRPRYLELARRHGERVVFLLGGQGVEGQDPELAEAGVRLWPEARSVTEQSLELLPGPSGLSFRSTGRR